MFTQRDMQIFYQIAGNTLNSWGYDDNITDRDGEVKL
jgi:hypothetical protein